MPNFTSLQEDLDRIYFTEHELIDQYYGNMLWGFGRNTKGQVGDGTIVGKSSPVTVAGGGVTWIQIAGGAFHSAAVKTDGTLWTWGQDIVTGKQEFDHGSD